MTITCETLESLRATVAGWRKAGERIALVPTMGALHAGHMSLVKAAKARADRVVASVFVNPTQFGPNEDYSRYPRTLEADKALLEAHDADMLWLPSVEEMYPGGFATSIHVVGVSEGLCGTFRPGHFDGVATVVAKLLLQVAPDVALFGEKDYQQLCVIKRLVTDLNIDTHIEGVPTLREADGLAMSSRNRYLSPGERAQAATLNVTLKALISELAGNKNGYSFNKIIGAAKQEILSHGFSRIDYLEWRENDSLTPVTHYQPNTRLLVAAWLGNTRLIDNMEVR